MVAIIAAIIITLIAIVINISITGLHEEAVPFNFREWHNKRQDKVDLVRAQDL